MIDLADIKARAYLFFRHLGQSTSSCLIVMTKGNLHTLTLDHWKTALFTGAISGILTLLLSVGRLLKLQKNPWFFALVAFIGTALADFIAHPSHFGDAWGEPLVTGLGAAFLSIILSNTSLGNYLVHLSESPSKSPIKKPLPEDDSDPS